MPALLFSSIVGAVTPSGLALLWPLLLVSLLHIVIGVIPAWLLGWAAGLPRDMLFFTVMASSLPNCGNLPWLFMPAIIKYFSPADQAADLIQYMVGLVSVYTIITILVTLTVPFLFKRPTDTLLLPRRRQSHEYNGNSSRELTAAVDHSSSTAAVDGNVVAAAGGGSVVQIDKGVGVHMSVPAPCHDLQSVLDSSPSPGNQHIAQDATPFGQQQQHLEGQGLITAGVVVAAAQSTLSDSCGSLDADDDECDSGPPPAAFGVYHPPPPAPPHLQHMQAADSFASHRSSSQLLQHSRQLLGSFSRSFRHSFSRGMKHSNSLVQLVWSYPHGWHRKQRGHRGTAAAAAGEAGGAVAAGSSGCCSCCPSEGEPCQQSC